MIYLDASVIVPLFVIEVRSAEARARLIGETLVASPLSLAETSSAIARRVRMGEILRADADKQLRSLDTWAAGAISICEVMDEDFLAATALIRRFDLGLRTPDALHVAIATRAGATLVTFDTRMAAAASALGLSVAP